MDRSADGHSNGSAVTPVVMVGRNVVDRHSQSVERQGSTSILAGAVATCPMENSVWPRLTPGRGQL